MQVGTGQYNTGQYRVVQGRIGQYRAVQAVFGMLEHGTDRVTACHKCG